MTYSILKDRAIHLLSCIFVCSLLYCQSQPTTRPADVSLCELVGKCTRYNQKRVRVRAEFISDGLEHSALVDAGKCSQGVQPWMSEDVDHHPDIKALDAALAKGQRGTLDKQIVATFMGKYECSSGVSTNAPRILHVESVTDISVIPRK